MSATLWESLEQALDKHGISRELIKLVMQAVATVRPMIVGRS